MEGRSFTVNEVAGILQCTRQAVYNLLAEGRLNAPVGRPSEDKVARISEKSLFQLMFFNYLRRFTKMTYDDLDGCRKNFGRFYSKSIEANCLSKDEGKSEAHPSPYPLPQGEGEHNCPLQQEPKQSVHHEFAELHQFSFGWAARQLSDDPDIQEDLVQEMSLAVLQYKNTASFEFLFELAVNRARNYLKYERRRGMLPLDIALEASDQRVEKAERLNAFIDELVRGGVPTEWMEEVLGTRLDAA